VRMGGGVRSEEGWGGRGEARVRGENDTAQGIQHHSGWGPRNPEALTAFLGNIYIKKLHRQIVLPYSHNNHTKNIGVISGSFLA
jgi:hypothetical protein